ncbi:MAG: YhgE/Pip domain-containing protein [Clostridia bacterium]|nr:YhgE/Pip domain-containing protein [Clostridia bacterium]
MSKIKNSWIVKAAIIIGVLVIPLMYTYFYLGAFWDPYARLDEVPVAVVNLDSGAEINGEERNLGEEICDNLKEDGSVKFIFTDEDDAEQGVMEDKYYASITIPQDFSYNASTASENTEKLHSAIVYSANQKKNYLAAQILENAMPTIKQTVNSNIDKEIITTLCEKLESVPDSMGELQEGFEQLSDGSAALYDGTEELTDGADRLANGSSQLYDGSKQVASGSNELATGIATLKDGTNTLNSSMPTLTNGVQALTDGASDLKSGTKTLNSKVPALTSGITALDNGATQLDEGLSTLTDNNAALTGGASQLSSGASSLQSGLKDYTAGVSSAYDGAASLESGVKQYTAGVSTAADGAKTLSSGVNQLSQGITSFGEYYTNAYNALKAYQATGNEQYLTAAVNGFEQLSGSVTTLDTTAQYIATKTKELSGGLSAIDENSATLNNGASSLKTGLETLSSKNTALNSGASTLASGASTLNSGIKTYTDGVTSAAGGASQLKDGTNTLAASAPALADGVKALDDGAGALSSGLNTLNAKVPALSDGVSSLNNGAGKLLTGANQLSGGANSLSDGANTLNNGILTLQTGTYELSDGAMRLKDGINTAKEGVDESVEDTNEQLKALDGLAEYSEEPVSTETTFVEPVENYGSAFAPYFMGLSLWVGGLMIYFGIYLDYNRKIKSLTKDSNRIVMRTMLFGLISMAQGALLAIVIKDILHITVNNPAMLFGACMLVSLTFMTIIQFCIINLGDVGKFVSLLLLILQLTSCAGTFPIETQNGFFRAINKVLPMTYSTQLFKEAISGTPCANARNSAVILALFFAAFLALTLILSHNKLKKDLERIDRETKNRIAEAKATA